MPIASNTKLISEITETFSKIDPNDKSTYDAAVDRFHAAMGDDFRELCGKAGTRLRKFLCTGGRV